MTSRLLSLLPLGMSVILGPTAVPAGMADDLVVLHIEAIGGQAAVNALKALRMDGHNEFGERHIPITIWSAVPDRIRMETRLNEETTLIQGFDGTRAWQVRVYRGRAREETMSEDERRQFINDAWFRGPLFDDGTRGIELRYEGVTTINDNRGFLIDVVRDGMETCSVLIAADNYQITVEQSVQVIRGRPVPVLHQFSEFQPIAGVWLPHRIETIQEDRLSIVTILENIEPNPELPPGIFEKPEIK